MTYNEKKSLYESIMKDISKTVKQKLNEYENLPTYDKVEDPKNAADFIQMVHKYSDEAEISLGQIIGLCCDYNHQKKCYDEISQKDRKWMDERIKYVFEILQTIRLIAERCVNKAKNNNKD